MVWHHPAGKCEGYSSANVTQTVEPGQLSGRRNGVSLLMLVAVFVRFHVTLVETDVTWNDLMQKGQSLCLVNLGLCWTPQPHSASQAWEQLPGPRRSCSPGLGLLPRWHSRARHASPSLACAVRGTASPPSHVEAPNLQGTGRRT